VLVSDVQKELEKIDANAERDGILNGRLQIPVTATPEWSDVEKQQELTTTPKAFWAMWCAESIRA
jgi:malate synthase